MLIQPNGNALGYIPIEKIVGKNLWHSPFSPFGGIKGGFKKQGRGKPRPHCTEN